MADRLELKSRCSFWSSLDHQFLENDSSCQWTLWHTSSNVNEDYRAYPLIRLCQRDCSASKMCWKVIPRSAFKGEREERKEGRRKVINKQVMPVANQISEWRRLRITCSRVATATGKNARILPTVTDLLKLNPPMWWDLEVELCGGI